PHQVLAAQERQRNGAGETSSRVTGALVAAQPAPRHLAGEAELVEPGRLVTRDPGGKHLALPARRGQLEAFELLDDAGEAFAAMEPERWAHVLPGEEEAHQVGRAHGLDVAPQAVQRPPVDAGEEASVAPLRVLRRHLGSEAAS